MNSPKDSQLGWSFRREWPIMLALTTLLLILSAFRVLALPDEGRYAEIGRWMHLSGDWLVPRLNGFPFFHKPPLLYWLEASVINVTGANIWFLRLIPSAHAVLILFLMGPVVSSMLGTCVAKRSVVIYGTSAAFLLGGQYINHDMMVSCWIGVAIGAWGWYAVKVQPQQSRGNNGRQQNVQGSLVRLKSVALLGFVASGLGVLSKGLIGIVLPGWVMLLWLLWSGRWFVLRTLPWFSGLSMFAIISTPWFICAEISKPGMLAYMFGVHQFERFTGTQFNNAQPVWFYFVAVSMLLGPWMFWFWSYQVRRLYEFLMTIQLTLSFHRVLLMWSAKTGSGNPRYEVSEQRLWIGLCVFWVWGIVGFFSIPSSKIIGYVLPVIPPMAVLSALGWERMMGGRSEQQVGLIETVKDNRKSNHSGDDLFDHDSKSKKDALLIPHNRKDRFIWICMTNLSIGLCVFVNYQSNFFSSRQSSADVASYLNCLDLTESQIMVAGEYAYDLPFLAKLDKPMWVIQDWEFERAHAADNWRRELFEGAAFEPLSNEWLKPLSALNTEGREVNRWLVVSANWRNYEGLQKSGFVPVFSGVSWNLYRSAPTKMHLRQFQSKSEASQCKKWQI
jgi:4-amino-4-deoxy-L-arabinose transferase-like glycosyltransferase